MSRQPNGRVAITKTKDGWYEAWPSTGERYPNGRPIRKHIKRQYREQVRDALKDFEDRQSAGSGIAIKIETVGQWLDHWLENIIRRGTKPRAYGTWRSYRTIITNYLKPAIGGYRLRGTRARLEPEHLEMMFARLPLRLSRSYRLQIYRVLDKALKTAVKQGKADRNVCELIERPETPTYSPSPLSIGEALAVVAAASEDEDGTRYLLGIVFGPRQGEVLGLRWSAVHLDPPAPDEPHIVLRAQVQRRTYEHGCADPVACVAEMGRCRVAKCPPRYGHGCTEPCGRKLANHCPARRVVKGCSTHKTKDGGPKKCPPLCPPKCAGHARHCPELVGGLVDVELKAHRADEKVPLGERLTELLRRERERQQRLYADFHMTWDPKGYVFQGVELGKPRDPRRDYEVWQRIRLAAGLGRGKLHVTRHTAATVMTALGTDLRVVQTVLGHAKSTTTEGYTQVAMGVKQQAVEKVVAVLLDGQLASLLGSGTVARNVAPDAFRSVPMQQQHGS